MDDEWTSTIDRVLDVDADRAWDLVTDADSMSVWMAGPVTLDLVEGGEGTVRLDEPTDAVALMAIEVVHPPRQLVFRWASSTRPPTRVHLRLTPMSPQQTRLTVTETFDPRGLAPLRVQNCVVALT